MPQPNPASAGGREYPSRPIVGVGAIVWNGEQILLVQRGQPPHAGMWSLPGGAVEAGELLAEAVVREVEEETGLLVEAGPMVEHFERITRDSEGRVQYHYVLLDFLCWPRGGRLQAASDAPAAAWFLPQELAQLAITPGTLEVVQRVLAQYGSKHP